MAAPLAGLALRSVSGALMKQGGRAVASKLLGRKKKMQPGKSKPVEQKVGGQRGALAVRPKTSIVSIPPSMAEPADVSASTTSSDSGYIEVINAKVIEIKNLLKGTLAAEKKEEDDRKRTEKRQDRKKQEAKLEKKGSKKGKSKMKGINMPRTGFFDSLFGFISNTILGFFAVRLIQYLPQILGFLKFLAPIGEFLIDVGIGLIDGFASFVDLGYKAYDFTRGALESIGGEGLANAFDGLMKAVDLAITVFTFGLLANKTMGGGLFGGKDKKPKTPKPKTTRIRTGPEEAFQAGRPKRMRAPGTTSQGAANRYTRRYGDRAAKRRFGKVPGKTGGFKMPSAKALKVGGGVLSAVMAGFEFAGRKGAGQTNLQAGVGTAASVGGGLAGAAKGAAVGAVLGPIGALVGGVIGGVAGSMLASGVADQVTGANKSAAAPPPADSSSSESNVSARFDMEAGQGYINNKPVSLEEYNAFQNMSSAEKIQTYGASAMNEGGGVGSVSSVSTSSQQPDDKDRKKPSYTPIKVPEGGKIVLEEKTEKAWWDFLGWAGTEGQEKSIKLGVGGMFLAKRVADVGNAFGEDEYFGPILSIASKFILGQKPDEQEYKNVGYGINLLVGDGVDENAIRSAYSEGGVVQAAMAGVDISGWVSKTFKKELAQAINKNYDMSESGVVESEKKQDGSTSGPGSAPGVRDSATGELMGGTATGAIAPSELYKQIGANEEQWNIYRNSVALIESGGEYGIPGGSGMYYDGRYQMGGEAKTDGAKYAGLPDPGHSDDPNAQVRAAYRADKELQEAIFTGFTLANHTYLMGNETYKNSSIERKLEILGYAHNQGMGGAEDWMTTGVVGADGFGTKGTKYTDLIAANFRAKKAGGELNLAEGAVEMKDLKPSPGQTEPTKITGKGSEAAENLLKDFPQIKARDTAQQIFASGLGFYLKKSGAGRPGTGDFGDPPGGDMEHPDHGGVVASHAGTGHDRGVALDLGANSATSGSYTEDQKTLWPYISDFLHKYGLHVEPFVPQVIHGPKESFGPKAASSFADGAHHNHFHVEFHKGGVVGGDGEVPAVLKSGEVVIDTDSSEYGPVKNMLLAVNQASGKEGVLSAIQDFAPYDMRGEQTVVVPQSAPPVPIPMPQYGSSSMMNFSTGRSENFSEFLDFQG